MHMPNHDRPTPARDNFALEALEPRVYLSATLDAGVLTVLGTPGDDSIVIQAGTADGEVRVKGDADSGDGTYNGVTSVVIDVGDGDDRVRVKGRLRDVFGDAMGVTILGGAGHDRLTGGPGDDAIDAGPGDDKVNGKAGDDLLLGGEGADRVAGGRGDDLIYADPGVDRLNGQAGTDTVSFELAESGIEVSLASRRVPSDGFGGGDARVRGFENVIGSSFDDLIEGDRKANLINAGDGTDLVINAGPRGQLVGVSGEVGDENGVVSLRAGFDDTDPADYADVFDTVGDDGSFELTLERLRSILGSRLSRRVSTLHLEAGDAAGNVTTLDLPIRRNTQVAIHPPLDQGPADATDDIDPDAPLPDGEHNITARATDVAGNVSGVSEPLSVVVDTQAPTVQAEAEVVDTDPNDSGGTTGSVVFNPVVIIPNDPVQTIPIAITPVFAFIRIDLVSESDTGRSNSDNRTRDNIPAIDVAYGLGLVVTDFSDPGLDTDGPDDSYLIELSVDGVKVADAVSEPGSIRFNLDAPLADGQRQFTAVARDLDTNEVLLQAAPLTITIDTVAPAPPSIDLDADSDRGFSNTDNITSVNEPRVTATAEDGSLIDFLVEGESLFTNGPVDGANESVTLPELPDGVHSLTATAEDLAGNVSGASEALIVTIDTVAPPPPVLDLLASSDTGISDTDNITRDNTPDVSAAAEPGSLIEVFVGGVAMGSEFTAGSSVFTLGSGG